MSDVLHIDLLSCVYKLPRDHPAPESVRSRLDEMARNGVARECAAAVGTMLSPDDPSVWVIDDLDVQVTIDVGAIDKPEAARLWASRIADRLAETVSKGPDEGAGVRRFASRAEYLAWLLGALLSGSPWTYLHTREFEGLRALPLSGLVTEALVRESRSAERILEALARAGLLESFFRIVTPERAIRILCVLAPSANNALVDRSLWQLVSALRSVAASPLEIYLRCRADVPLYPPAAVRAAVELCIAFREAVADAGVRALLLEGRSSPALQLCHEPSHREALLQVYELAAGDSAWMKSVTEAAAPESGGSPADSFESAFGGVFLLLPDLIALFPDASPVVRFVVLLKCMGREAAPSAWRDPALRIAAGIAEVVSLKDIDACHMEHVVVEESGEDLSWFSLDKLLPAGEKDEACSRAALLLMRTFARRFMRLEHSSPAYLYRNILSGSATIVKSEGSLIVRLRPRPFQILLRMAGIDGLTVAVPWLRDADDHIIQIVFELADD